jgi:hypothetical protein
MKRVSLVAAAVLVGFTAVLTLRADDTKGTAKQPPIQFDKDGRPMLETAPLAAKEKELAEKYASFEKSLLILQQRLANSPDAKDRERSKQLEKVLSTSGDRDILKNFQQLVRILNEQKLDNTGNIGKVVQVAQSLAKDLKEILDLLKSDNGASSKKDERLALERFVKELEKVIRDEKIIRDQTRRESTDPKKIADDQSNTTNDTQKLVSQLGKDGKKGDGGEAKDFKGLAKDKGKGGEKAAEGKNDGKNKIEGGKTGDAKDGGKGDAKKGDQKPGGDGKGDPKGGSKDGKEGSKAGDAKKADPKGDAGAPKSGDQSKGEQGKAKSGDAKSQGASKGGQGGDSQGGAKADGNPPPPQGANNPKDDVGQTRKRIQEAIENMKQLEEEIMKGKRPEAEREGDQAIAKLEEAKKKLEDLIRQLREEELERVLAALINRCQKMLAMQEEVLRGTLRVQNEIEISPSKKAERVHVQAGLNLSDDELKIVHEATKAIEILETEGTAVAFPEVFQQVREDMKHVQRRLKGTDFGDVTVTIEVDIIDTLKEMIKALEKAKKDLDDKKNPPKPNDNPPPPPQDQKLIEKIAELKMLKSMQLRVNARTELYSRRYQGEQAAEAGIREELRELSGRQERIMDAANKMAKGDNQ